MDSHGILSLVFEVAGPSPAERLRRHRAERVLFRVSPRRDDLFHSRGLHKLRGALAYLRLGKPWPPGREGGRNSRPRAFASALAATIVQFAGGAPAHPGTWPHGPVALLVTVTLGVAIYQNIAHAVRDPQLAGALRCPLASRTPSPLGRAATISLEWAGPWLPAGGGPQPLKRPSSTLCPLSPWGAALHRPLSSVPSGWPSPVRRAIPARRYERYRCRVDR